jgi:replication-associated recombination protein RarA
MFEDFDMKYTPKSLADIVFLNDSVKEQIEDCVSGAIGFPSSGTNGIVLYGINGTGKSALAKILPNLIEQSRGGESANARFFNISVGGDNGASIIESIKTQASLISFPYRYHYFVLDEVDNLRKETMLSLKNAMNVNTNNCIYIMTTNNLSALDRGVLSRSICVEFNVPTSTRWLAKCKALLSDYAVTNVHDSDLLKIIDLCNGDIRKIMSSIKRLIVKSQPKVA